MIGDPDRRISTLYDMIHPNVSDTFTVRSLFIVGPDNRVKLTLTYPANTGRSFEEILRALDALQLTADYSVATPSDWRHGDEVVISAIVHNYLESAQNTQVSLALTGLDVLSDGAKTIAIPARGEVRSGLRQSRGYELLSRSYGQSIQQSSPGPTRLARLGTANEPYRSFG